jgi:hypothetical protein
VKARIWKNQKDGAWCFEVRNSAGRVWWAGFRRTWEETLSLVLSELDPPRLFQVKP